MKKEIIPALIAKTQEELTEAINKVKDHAKILQLDVMDGIFVPNHSLDFDFKLPKTNCRYEAHLMINNPEEWISINLDKAELFLVHYESTKYHAKIIKLIKSKGKKAGLVINPETSVEQLNPFLKELDQILVMSVNPGFYGSKFLPETMDKVRELRKLAPKMEIEVDGGVTADTIKLVNDSGANLFVSGSYILKSENPKKAVETLKNLVK